MAETTQLVRQPPDADRQWCRIVMNQTTRQWIGALDTGRLSVLEIAGTIWEDAFAFRSYRAVFYSDYDVCAGTLDETFDLVIAEQVFEHVLWPYRAGRNIHQMVNPGGYVLITVPFLIRIHDQPVDCSRWTELGLKHLLAECGFPLDTIRTGSWGNRACVVANFTEWAQYAPERHSLDNEPDFPMVVWALAQKEAT
ncbi:methyltransferase domain-containing protein [Frankia sp. CiP3]|uniref:methyltransferase domain-containing protein n=1 Tax=Frankia sp. CiP3 TaxID=2880971 RepID=UPI001EF72014|nr:methyltransferase domain-containing protein [Frankia sp. CiP3]